MATTSKPSGSFNNQFKVENQDVARDLATKLRLEYAFKKDLKNFFNDLANKFENSYAETGQVMPANLYERDLRKILVKNYKVISKKFDSKLRMSSKNAFLNIEYKQVDHQINSQIDGYIDIHSGEQSDIMTQTNQNELTSSINKVANTAAVAGLLLNRREVAQEAKQEFLRKAIPRIETIATTETQNMAEYAKWIEASNINNIPNIRGINRAQLKKQWVTILDEKTRFDHVAADGQMQFVAVPYVVGGDKMMSPGDPSLGAKVGNFINCRCSSVFILPEGDDAEFVDPTQLINASSQDLVADYVDDKGNQFGVVRGYAATYAQQGNAGEFLLKEDVDLALKKLKDEKVEWLPMYYKHNAYNDEVTDSAISSMSKDKIIGWFKVDDLISTKTGLYAEGFINTVTPKPGWGSGTIKEIKDGKLKAFSIGYNSKLPQVIDLPSGSKIDRGLTIKEISIVSTGDLPEAALMPINRTLKPQVLKPKTKPQAPVDPRAPQTYDVTGMTPKEIAASADELGYGTNAEVAQAITEDLAAGLISASEAARRRALLAGRIGPNRNPLDGLSQQDLMAVAAENSRLLNLRADAERLTRVQAITRARPTNRVLFGDEWGILTNEQVDSYVRSMTADGLMLEREARLIRESLRNRFVKPVPNTSRFTAEELRESGDEWGFQTNAEIEANVASELRDGLISQEHADRVRRDLQFRVAPIEGIGVPK